MISQQVLSELYHIFSHQQGQREIKITKREMTARIRDCGCSNPYDVFDILVANGIARETVESPIYAKGYAYRHHMVTVDVIAFSDYIKNNTQVKKEYRICDIIDELREYALKPFTRKGLKHLMMRLFGMASNPTINKNVNMLESLGYLERVGDGVNRRYWFTADIHEPKEHDGNPSDSAIDEALSTIDGEYIGIVANDARNGGNYGRKLCNPMWRRGVLASLHRIKRRLVGLGWSAFGRTDTA